MLKSLSLLKEKLFQHITLLTKVPPKLPVTNCVHYEKKYLVWRNLQSMVCKIELKV